MSYQPQNGRIADEPLKDHPEYRWRRKLGEEAYGSVVKAEDRATGQLVAIKLMDNQQVASMKNYVVRDISEHAKCGAHPNITQYIKCFTTDKHLGIVTQYAAGGDLMSVISAQKGLSEGEARHLFRQLLVALDFCARLGVSNHDVRLENTLLERACPSADSGPAHAENGISAGMPTASTVDARQTAAPEPASDAGSSGRAGEARGASVSAPASSGGAAGALHADAALLKLCAFGPSIRAHHSQPWRQDGGSLCYNPPEALMSRRVEGTVDEAATAWICGVFLYCMLCDQYPFGDASNVRAVLDVRERMMKADYGRPHDRKLSDDVVDLLDRIFVVDPEQRIALAGIQAHAWVTASSAPLDLDAVNGPWVSRSQAAWTPEAEEAIVAVVAKCASAAMAAMGSGDLNEAELDDLLNDEDYDF